MPATVGEFAREAGETCQAAALGVAGPVLGDRVEVEVATQDLQQPRLGRPRRAEGKHDADLGGGRQSERQRDAAQQAADAYDMGQAGFIEVTHVELGQLNVPFRMDDLQ